MLHLFLARRAGADDGLLDLTRRILVDIDVETEGCAQCSRPRMPEFEGTPRVLVHKDALDRHHVGVVFRNDLTDRREYLFEAVRKVAIGTADRAAGHVGRLVARKIEHAEAGLPRAGIDAENASCIGQFGSQS